MNRKINISVALRFAVWITPVKYQDNCLSFWVLLFSPPGGALVALTSPLTCPIYWGMMGGIFPVGSWLRYRYFIVVCVCVHIVYVSYPYVVDMCGFLSHFPCQVFLHVFWKWFQLTFLAISKSKIQKVGEWSDCLFWDNKRLDAHYPLLNKYIWF